MIREAKEPKAWRLEGGLSLQAVARAAGIGGKNPSRTYSRYETGESQCPAEVVETIADLSGGAVDAESWHRVRMRWLHARPPGERA